MKKLFVLSIICLAINTQGQLAVRGGFSIGSKVGVHYEPYNGSLEFPVFFGFELGYRLDPRFDLRLLYYTGQSQNLLTSGLREHRSTMQRYGINPQFAFYISPKKVFRFEMGIPISKVEQEVNWTDGREEPSLTWGAPGFRATGIDKAKFIAFGLSPRACFHLPKNRLQMEIGFEGLFYELRSASRTVDENTGTKDYSGMKAGYSHFSLALCLSLGYSFW